MSGFQSMADMRRDQEQARDAAKGKGKDGKGPAEFYAGGERSGMALEGGPISDLSDPWAEARRRGAVDPNADGQASGTIVTIYADGFTVNRGPFRDAADPANAQFLKDIHSGVCPEELKGEGNDVQVSVMDKRPMKFADDQSTGTSGGGALSSGSGRNPIKPGQADLSQGATAGPTASGQGQVDVDESKETTTIQIRFGDGKRVQQQFNVDAKVAELFKFIADSCGTDSFKVTVGFPPRPIIDKSQTLKEANLLREQVSVKN